MSYFFNSSYPDGMVSIHLLQDIALEASSDNTYTNGTKYVYSLLTELNNKLCPLNDVTIYSYFYQLSNLYSYLYLYFVLCSILR